MANIEVSEVIHLSDLFQEWNAMLTPDDFYRDRGLPLEKYVEAVSGITCEMSRELEAVCGQDTLECEEEIDSVTDQLKTLPEGTVLQTLSAQKKLVEACQELGRHGASAIYKSRTYKFIIPDLVHTIQDELQTSEREYVATPDLLIRVKIYKPAKGTVFSMNLVPVQEYDVLGSQNLTSLRDSIQCLNDYCIPGEFSTNPDIPKDLRTKDLYKSGFFFIEGTFYNDTRDSNARDYSKVITEWAKDPNRCMGPYKTETMEYHTFMDLKLRLGQPYVYIHQGDCEHLLVFSEIRMYHPDDCSDCSQYPVLVDRLREKRILCRACLTNSATWVTRESPLAPEDPCFFCDTCLKGLHYDKNGKKIVDFRAYPYVNRALLNEGKGVAKPQVNLNKGDEYEVMAKVEEIEIKPVENQKESVEERSGNQHSEVEVGSANGSPEKTGKASKSSESTGSGTKQMDEGRETENVQSTEQNSGLDQHETGKKRKRSVSTEEQDHLEQQTKKPNGDQKSTDSPKSSFSDGKHSEGEAKTGASLGEAKPGLTSLPS